LRFCGGASIVDMVASFPWPEGPHRWFGSPCHRRPFSLSGFAIWTPCPARVLEADFACGFDVAGDVGFYTCNRDQAPAAVQIRINIARFDLLVELLVAEAAVQVPCLFRANNQRLASGIGLLRHVPTLHIEVREGLRRRMELICCWSQRNRTWRPTKSENELEIARSDGHNFTHDRTPWPIICTKKNYPRLIANGTTLPASSAGLVQ
jgi:hypothetical protein